MEIKLDYNQEEKIKNIQQFISTHTIDRLNCFKDKEVLDADFKWNASLFFAKAIHLAETKKKEFTPNQFIQFRKEYKQNTGKSINADILFSQYWLRTVLGKVKIAGLVDSACSAFERISNYKNELEFLVKEFPVGKEGSNKLTKDEFDKIKREYENNFNLTLNEKGLFEQSWLSLKDDQVQISQMNYFFKAFLDSWDQFEFLSEYKKHVSKDLETGSGLKIEIKSFKELNHFFCKFHKEVPSISKLKEQQVLKEKDKFYYLNLFDTKPKYWKELSGKIIAHYWQLLLDDNLFDSDVNRIFQLLNQTEYFDWSTEFLFYVPEESKKRFLNAALEIVVNEPDLNKVPSEFRKVSIDADFGSHYVELLFNNPEKFDDFSLNEEDSFELLESFNKWELKAKSTYLQGQSSRKEISYLIHVIIKHDFEIERIDEKEGGSYKLYYYKRIFNLLDEVHDKPILIWKVKCYILLSRRDFLPYLLIDKRNTSFAFQLIDFMAEFFHEKETQQTSIKLWEDSIDLALNTIRSVGNEGSAAKQIFQIYRQLNRDKYFVPFNRNQNIENQNRKKNKDKESLVLSLIENSSLFNHKYVNNQYLIPFVFNDLINLFIQFKSKPLYNNGTVNFPMIQWDGIAWLMKCSTYWKYKQQFELNPPNIHSLTNTFFKLYIDRIEVTEVNKYNFSDEKEEKGLPLWSEKIERLDHIEWVYPIYFIFKQQKLNSFLEPRFYFSSTTDQYHKENKFTADKLRTHIGVLLQVLSKLVLPSIPYGFNKEDLAEIKSRVEQQIIDFLKSHTKDIPEEGRIDLFDYQKEWAYNTSEKEALLPQIAKAIYWYNNKEKLIDTIIESQDITKVLTIVRWTTSEGLKQKLIEKLKESDIKIFLENSTWIPEIQNTLLEISKYPQLKEKLEQIVDFWEKEISRKNYKYANQLFQTKMLIAYYNTDEEELNRVDEPQKQIARHSNEFTFDDHKQFYRALIRLESNTESAYQIFKNLSFKYPKYPVLALNQMAAKINIAKSEGDDLETYREALEEWNIYASKNKQDEKTLGSPFIVNRLLILFKLQEFERLDKLYVDLDLPYQMLPNVLEVKIDSLIQRKRIGEALFIIEKSKSYHTYSDLENIGFIYDLEIKVNGIDNIEELHFQYNRIFNSQPSKLIKILPEKLNGKSELTEFIVKEVAIAASNMLDKVHSLPEVLNLQNTSKENRFNDLIQLALGARISSWGWSVKDQTRQGFSPSEKDLGEIDLDIRDNNQLSFITCEAFILRDTSRVQSHLEKLITHYTHNRKAFLILIYFQGKQTDYQKDWKKYYQTTLTSISYPKGYEINSNKVKDISKVFGYDNSGIRVGMATLESGSIIYHLFVNINYKIN